MFINTTLAIWGMVNLVASIANIINLKEARRIRKEAYAELNKVHELAKLNEIWDAHFDS